MIAMTRAALGVGIGLLLSEWIGGPARRAVGWALVVSGTLFTIPLAAEVLHKGRRSDGVGTSADARTDVQERSVADAAMNAYP